MNNASADHVALRASELAVEQRARLDVWMQTHTQREQFEFYIQATEVEVNVQIAQLLTHYAVLKGYIVTGQELRITRPATRERTSDEL